MSTVCYCGQPDCPVTTWEHDACDANLRAERDALKAQLAKAHERLDEFGMRRDGQTATLEEGIDAMRGQLLDYQRWAYEAEGRESKLKTQFAEAVEAVTAALAVTNNAAHVMGCLADPDDHPACCWIDQCRAFLAKVKP